MLILCIAILGIVFLQYSTNIFLSLGPQINIIFTSFSLTIIPGYFLNKFFFSEYQYNFLELLPQYFILGFTFFGLFAFISYFIELSLTNLIKFYLLACIILGISLTFFYKKFHIKTLTKIHKTISGSHLDKKSIAVLITLVTITFFMSLHYGGWISGDAIIHLPKIRQIVELNKIEYNNIFIKGLKKENRGHNVLYPFQSAVSKITKTDPIESWAVTPVLFTTMRLLTFFLATKYIFGSEQIANLSTFVLFLWENIFNIDIRTGIQLPHWVGGRFPCPTAFQTIYVPIILFYVFIFLNTNKKIFFMHYHS